MFEIRCCGFLLIILMRRKIKPGGQDYKICLLYFFTGYPEPVFLVVCDPSLNEL